MAGTQSRTPVAISSFSDSTCSPVSSVVTKRLFSHRASVTVTSRTSTVVYGRSSSRASPRNSSGGMPSRVRKPCMACEASLRGCPLSQTSTLRRHRPSTSAALSPAGPAPTMTTSYMGVEDLLEAGVVAEPLEVEVAGRARVGERGLPRGDTRERIKRAVGIAAEGMKHGNVVARRGIVRTFADPGFEGLEGAVEVARRIVGLTLPAVRRADTDAQLDVGALAQRVIAGIHECQLALVFLQRVG